MQKETLTYLFCHWRIQDITIPQCCLLKCQKGLNLVFYCTKFTVERKITVKILTGRIHVALSTVGMNYSDILYRSLWSFYVFHSLATLQMEDEGYLYTGFYVQNK